MARAADPNSADSQFYICFDRVPHLDGKYTVWGQVVDGMAYVGMLKRGRAGDGMVIEPDYIVKMQVAADTQ